VDREIRPASRRWRPMISGSSGWPAGDPEFPNQYGWALDPGHGQDTALVRDSIPQQEDSRALSGAVPTIAAARHGVVGRARQGAQVDHEGRWWPEIVEAAGGRGAAGGGLSVSCIFLRALEPGGGGLGGGGMGGGGGVLRLEVGVGGWGVGSFCKGDLNGPRAAGRLIGPGGGRGRGSHSRRNARPSEAVVAHSVGDARNWCARVGDHDTWVQSRQVFTKRARWPAFVLGPGCQE